MKDALAKEQRSERMGLIRGRDTKPEMTLRRLAHRLGYRYRRYTCDPTRISPQMIPGKKPLAF